MKPQTIKIMWLLGGIVAIFLVSSVCLSLYLILYEWMRDVGFGFWGFVFTFAGLSAVGSFPKLYKDSFKIK